jgi:hypothetical protein
MKWESREIVIDLPTMDYTGGRSTQHDNEVRERFNDWLSWQLQILHKYEGWIADEPIDFESMWMDSRVLSIHYSRDGVSRLQAAKVRVKRPVT